MYTLYPKEVTALNFLFLNADTSTIITVYAIVIGGQVEE